VFVSYAQNFEDVLLHRAFRNLDTGFYIDIGAAHPDTDSVTRAFYDRGWHGINVEPSAEFHTRLSAARQRDINLLVAVGETADTVTFHDIVGTGLSTLDPIIASMHQDAGWPVSQRTVQQITLAELCREHVATEVHFLKIDVEGAERAVLAGADFGLCRPWVVLIEATRPLSQEPNYAEWEPILLAADYHFVWFDGLNRFYLAAERYDALSEHFVLPPNVFDDFVRASDNTAVRGISEAQTRAAMLEQSLAAADTRSRRAEERADQAVARADQATARAEQAESRSDQERLRCEEAQSRQANAEAQANRSRHEASAAEAAQARAEAWAANADAARAATVQELAALRASTSWQMTRPVRIAGWLAKGRLGAALIETGMSRERAERLRQVAGGTGGHAKRASRIAFYTAARAAQRMPGFSALSLCFERTAPPAWRWFSRHDEAYLRLATGARAATPAPYQPRNTAPAGQPPIPLPAAALSHRTRKVHQFHSGSHVGDAVTNSMFLIQRMLRQCGYESEIFVEHRDPRLADRLFEIHDLPLTGNYVLVVHHSMGYDAFERILGLRASKVLMYHNITPIEFLADFPAYIPYAELGRRQLAMMRSHMAAALADSEFNALELRGLEYEGPQACTMLFDLDDLLCRAARVQERPSNAPFTVLFVGRVVASKGQAELVEAFAAFCREWTAPCRLVLVGKVVAPDAPYATEIARKISDHGLQDKVTVTGLVSDEGLHEWYRAADLYVSLSYHEGFGVPLVEAMAHGVPVVAWPAGAVPYTLGGAAELLHERAPDAVAAAMLRIARDARLRAAMIARQREVLERFRLDRHIPTLVQAVMAAGAATPARDASRGLLAANLRFTVIGHVTGTYSLAAITRLLASALEQRQQGTVRLVPWENGPVDGLSGVPDAILPLMNRLCRRAPHVTGPEIVISHHFPLYVPTHRGDLTMALIPWEESLLPAEMVQVLNQDFTAILAPSAFVAKVLVDSGVAIPVRNVGQAPDLERFRKVGIARDDSNSRAGRPFTFLHVSSCFPRKGVDALLAAYIKAFRKDDRVRLVIKSFPNMHNDVPEQVEDLRGRDPHVADICVINHDLDEAGLADLYREADAAVLPTRGEGFNLPAAEAMAAGLPLIVTGFGGHLDFCNRESARLVDYRFAPSRSHVKSPGSLWVEPDIDDLAAAMREVMNDTQSGGIARKRMMRARAAIGPLADTRAWASRIADTATALLTALPLPPLRVAWVSTWNVRCGIAEYSRALLDRLNQPEVSRQPSITVLCDDRTPSATTEQGMRVVPAWRMGDADSMSDLARAVSTEDPDVLLIQYHSGFFSWQGLASLLADRRVSRRITVLSLHATQRLHEIDGDERLAVLGALAGVHRILVHQIADLDFLKDLGLTANVTLFPHGATRPAGQRSARDLQGRATALIGSFGFFLPGKGIPRLIEALARLRADWPALRLRLVNAEYGYGMSSDEIARCRELAGQYRVESAIEWKTEFLPDDECRRLLAECDLLVLPYDPTKESSSAAVRGALSSGVPVAVTPVPIFTEADGAVHRFAAVDTDAVVQGIDSLLRDRDARQRLQDAAAVWLAERDWDVVARRLNGMLYGLRAQRIWENQVDVSGNRSNLVEAPSTNGKSDRVTGQIECMLLAKHAIEN